MNGLIVLVTGGREYRDKPHAWEVLDALHEASAIGLLVQGGASGADALAFNWATRRGIQAVTYLPNWSTYGPSAGPRRNRAMFDHARPDIVLAFQGGAGTANMIGIARNALKTHGVLCELRACCREHPLP